MLSAVGTYIVNGHPTFDSRNNGYARLGVLLRSLSFVEVSETQHSKDLPYYE